MTNPPPDHLSTISPRALSLIHSLSLTYLPHESGYIGLLGTLPPTPPTTQSQNYYLLTSALPVNYLHHLAPSDTHILIEGGPVSYFIFHPDGHCEKIILGRDFEAGQTAVVAVPGGCWKGLMLEEGAEYALMANVLVPGFTVEGVRIGEGEEWVKRYEGKAEWATEGFLRGLVGPNWKGHGREEEGE
jgi:predicted cupin superfamily sugar epimerase